VQGLDKCNSSVGALGMLAGAAVVLLAGLLASFPIVLVGRVLMGLGAALALPATTAMMIDVYTQQERGGALDACSPSVWSPRWPRRSSRHRRPVLELAVDLPDARRGGRGDAVVAPPRVIHPATGRAGPARSCRRRTVVPGRGKHHLRLHDRGHARLDRSADPGSLAIGLVFLVVFVVVELRKTDPLLQVRLLKIRNVGVGVFLMLMRFLPAVILGPFIPIFLQEVMGFPRPSSALPCSHPR